MRRNTPLTSAPDAGARTPPESRWRLITGLAEPDPDQPEARAGALNMAIDQVLFESVQAGGPPALRLYRWSPACLSLGRNQSATIDHTRLAEAGIDLVRRPTGGLAVLHADELTYAVAVPAGTVGSPRKTYEAVNRGLLRGLSTLKLSSPPAQSGEAGLRGWTDGRKEGETACFAITAPGEVVARGRKLIGSAQRYEKRTILQHGSILLGGEQTQATRLLSASGQGPLRSPIRDPRSAIRVKSTPASITLAELLGRVPSLPELARAFSEGVARELGISLAPATLSEAERNRALELSVFFGSSQWTYRV